MPYEIPVCASHKVRMAAVPVGCLDDIRRDILRIERTEKLNDFQRWILDERYVLSVPGLDFVPQSIVLAAAPFEMKTAAFLCDDMRFECFTCMEKDEYWREVELAFESAGFRIAQSEWLPRKRLATRMGLVNYGRNNITYAPGMGSFFGMMAFFSDMPAPQDYVWREAGCMSECASCMACVRNCPTGAMDAEKFIINTDKCLSNMMETGTYPNADARRSVHALDGCYRCQSVCPRNAAVLAAPRETVVFDRQDTAQILGGDISPELAQRLADAGISRWAHKTAPANLKIIFDSMREART